MPAASGSSRAAIPNRDTYKNEHCTRRGCSAEAICSHGQIEQVLEDGKFALVFPADKVHIENIDLRPNDFAFASRATPGT
jgi:hypothetical protein